MLNFCLLITLVLTQVLGDIWLSRGMKLFGEVNTLDINKLIIYLFTNFWIILGVFTLTVSMGIYLVSVSRLDLSYVLPIHASSYVLNALLAWLILGENVTVSRWLAAILISLGVFLVSLSIHQSQKVPKQSSDSVIMFFLPLGISISRVFLGSICLALADSVGDVLTAKGIKQIGEFPSHSIKQVFIWLVALLTNPLMVAGIAGYTGAFLIFLCLLSWADISLVRPATATGYIFSLLGARFFLHERISRLRLGGIIPIGLGIILVN